MLDWRSSSHLFVLSSQEKHGQSQSSAGAAGAALRSEPALSLRRPLAGRAPANAQRRGATRTYQERLDTLDKVRDAGIKVCSGGIVGLGESVKDRAGLLLQLANLPTPPESVPINMLVKVKGTPLADNEDVDAFDFIRTIAVARIMMPTSYVRLSAGREQMNEQTQAMCFMAGANSIFYGCKLLTTPNPEEDKDLQLFRKLGINPQQTAVLEGDNEQQQRLEQALLTPDTEEYYNAAAL